MAAGTNNESSLRLNVHVLIAGLCRDSENSSRSWVLTNDLCHFVPQKELCAFRLGTFFKSSSQSRTRRSIDRFVQIIRIHFGDDQSGNSAPIEQTGLRVVELDTILD